MQNQANPQSNMVMLAARIQPRPGELKSAQNHLYSVRRRLTMSFDVSKIVYIGSHKRSTAIRWYSDFDVMVVLRRNEAKWGGNLISSSSLLEKIRNDLQDRYTHTEVRRDKQAVVLGFAAGQQSLDVVPALFLRLDKLRPVYMIPDGSGSWLETSPEAHTNFFATADKRSSGKLKKVIQLLKWWKFSREQPIPIQSFHLDLLLANSGLCIGVKSYTHCLYDAFKLLADRECRGLHDPLGISGTVYAAQTEPQREIIIDAVQYALAHSRDAVVAEASNDFSEANRQWSIVFNGEY
jgi:hypothetical protein